MTVKQYAFIGSMILTLASAARADIEIDPIYNNGFGVNLGLFAPVAQSFTADVSDITWIGMDLATCNCEGLGYTPIEFQLDLLNGDGIDGTLVSSETATAPWALDGFLYFDFSGTDLVVGNPYTVVISQLTPNPPPMGGGGVPIGGTSNVYAGGEAYCGGNGGCGNGTVGFDPDTDFYLRVLSTEAIPPIVYPQSPAPDPSSVILLSTIIGAVILTGKRRSSHPRNSP